MGAGLPANAMVDLLTHSRVNPLPQRIVWAPIAHLNFEAKKGHLMRDALFFMVGRVGFEPTTNWLKANCSTN
ncbi:protein of unknown function [Pseudomonas sp. JV551A1]|uniref:Uncharacterized protein n=1 Tax=Pseudomonas inefficax TaxID=2078786 RepID=A0AAQ1SS11_9PSED|nr:protein of unknown function [Pseudomonas sp. JV551A1]SPO59166.1 protein of unknown function [Pseudomonas inefficax]